MRTSLKNNKIHNLTDFTISEFYMFNSKYKLKEFKMMNYNVQ